MGRHLKHILVLILTWLILLPGLCWGDAGLEKEMQQALIRSRKIVAGLSRTLEKRALTLTDIGPLKAVAEEMTPTHLLLKERFTARESRAASLGIRAGERHERMTTAYLQVIETFLSLTGSIQTAEDVTPALLESLKTLLQSAVKKEVRPIYGSMPYKHLNYPATAPVKTPVVVPAYLGGDKTISPDDLSPSPEAPKTQEIAALSESLHWSPVEIYEWVKNTIDSEWYYGCMKGAEETLRQRSGNDCDQAALLVALMRSAGYPARYVTGVIQFFPDIETAKRLTGLDDENELAGFFQKAGIPFTPVISGGRIINFEISHVWVEVNVPLANYRGAVIDEHGKSWLGLDTSIKSAGYAQNEPLMLPKEIAFTELMEAYLTTPHGESFLTWFRNELTSRMSVEPLFTTYDDLLHTKTLTPEVMGILPSSLQFRQTAITGEYTRLPDALFHTVRFTGSSPDGKPLLDATLFAHELSNKQITVTYDPETVEDQEIVNSYGGLDTTPAYLVHLRPVIMVAGKRAAVGTEGLPMGSDYTLTIELSSPNGTETVSNPQTMGVISAVAIVSQNAIMPDAAPEEEKDGAWYLYEEAVSYISRWDQSESELGSLLGLWVIHPIPTVVTVGSVVDVTWLLDTPHELFWKGVYIDADLRAVERAGGVSLDEDPGIMFMKLSGMEGSTLENLLFEEDFGVESISTVKLMGLANTTGIPILEINRNNVQTSLESLDLPENIEADIENAVNAGYGVRIPATEITYESFTGIGYIRENPLTGEAGFMLSGMIAGGMTVVNPEEWEWAGQSLIENSYTGTVNEDPASAVAISKIPVKNFRGTVGSVFSETLQVAVTDATGKRVTDAPVKFTVTGGGGMIATDGATWTTSVTVTTNDSGIAQVHLKLGEKTADNPFMWHESGYTYSQQVGQNIVDAALATGKRLKAPFLVYGFPDEATAEIKEVLGNGMSSYPYSWAGLLKVKVVDQYGNAISNKSLTFAMNGSNPVDTGSTPTRLISPDDPCMAIIPTNTGVCGSAIIANRMTDMTGAGVQVVMGSQPETEYFIKVSCNGLADRDFAAFTNNYGSIVKDPWMALMIKGKYFQECLSGRAGGEWPISATSYVLDVETNGDVILHDDIGGPVTICGKTVSQDPPGSKFYQEKCVIQPGLNQFEVVASGQFHGSYCNCDKTLYEKRVIQVYGLEITPDTTSVMGFLDSENYLCGNVDLKFLMTSPECQTGMKYVFIYDQEGRAIAILNALEGDAPGKYIATLSGGSRFNPGKYTAKMVVNYGNGDPYEVWSEAVGVEMGTGVVESISIKDDKYPIPPGDTAIARATTTPKDLPVTWAIIDKDNKEGTILVVIDPDSGVMTVDKNSASGWVTLRASIAGSTCVYKDAKVYIGCLTCEQSGSVCNMAGSGFIELSSIDIRFSLGKTNKGRLAGDLFLQSHEPSPDLSTPKALVLSSLGVGPEVRYDHTGNLRQILSLQSLIDIVIIDDFKYEIRFFRPADITGDTDGLYKITPTANPITVWKIENPDASDEVYNRLRVTQVQEGTTKQYDYEYNEGQRSWSLNKGNGQRIETRSEGVDQAANNRIVTHTIKDNTGKIASVVKTTYHTFPWGEEIIEKVADPGGAALTTAVTFYEDPQLTGSYGQIKIETAPDGSQTAYQYDGEGRKTKEIRSWLDTSDGRVTLYDYTPVDPVENGDPEFVRSPRTVVEQIEGNTVGKTYHAYLTGQSSERIEIVEQCAVSSSVYGDAENLRTVRTYYASDTEEAGAGKVKSVQYPDGRMEIYSYEYGVYTPGSDITVPGTFMPGSGTDIRETRLTGTSDHPSGIAYKTTQEIIIQNDFGNELVNETRVYTGNAYDRIKWRVTQYDEFGRAITMNNSDSTKINNSWGCCAKTSETDAQGISSGYIYDDLSRLKTATKEGDGAQPDILTTYAYDAEGRRLTETQTAGGLSLLSQTVYDTVGRIDTSTDPTGLLTDYNYSNGGRITTIVHPGGATEVTERYLDGQIKSITGTAVVPRFYTYGVNPHGTTWTEVHAGSETSPLWEKTTTDMIGRTVKVDKPGYVGIETTTNIYNDKNQLVKTTTTGQADTLFAYDALGNQIRTGLDIDGNGALETGSSDRIADTETAYITDNGDYFEETVTQTYPKENDGTAVITGRQKTRLTGLGTGGLAGESVSVDISGNQTLSKTFINRAAKALTQIIDSPNATNPSTQLSVNGLLISSTSQSGYTLTYGYDALGRRTGITDPRTGTSITHYNTKGQVDYMEDPLHNRKSFTYDDASGRKISEKNPLSIQISYAYNDRSQVTKTWGAGSYPVQYVYDDYGRMTEMHTFRTDPGFTGDTWPEASAGAEDKTIWRYHEATGLLDEKEDDAGNRVMYTYGAGGKLKTRMWSREENGSPILTTYDYDFHTGELISIDYSDTTPDITFVYDRLGRQKTVTDSVGTRTFAYNDADLQLHSETMTGLYTKTITRNYENIGVKGRNTGFTADGYAVTYGYESESGRFKSIGWNINGQTDTMIYAYTPNSDLIGSLSTPTGLVTTYSYEPNRNLKTAVNNAFNTALISEYGYQYDSLGRRTSAKTIGQAFVSGSGEGFNLWGYNDKNELTTSNRYQGTDMADLSQPVIPEKRAYDYDPIGNRKTLTEGSASGTYISNNLNQYANVLFSGQTTSLSYDEDGNMTLNGDTRYTWNAENRLVATEPTVPADGGKKIEYLYDYLGRRVKKSVYVYEIDHWTLTTDHLFLYDGWNLIEEITRTGGIDTSRYFAWGLDLSQSIQGAGGVGGLVAIIDGTSTYLPAYDANGNVGQLIAKTGSIMAANYTYDPFGKIIASTGTYANNNPFRFSTKYWDEETGLVYYTFRDYSTELGRWIGKDPVEEEGGLNLYVFVTNNGINKHDLFGLWGEWLHRDITYQAYRLVTPEYDDLNGGKIWEAVLQYLRDANISVDSGETFKNNYWHFNRGIDEDIITAKDAYFKISYDYWNEIVDRIAEPNKGNCFKALEFVGMLSHSWQDYYAHAIHKDSDGSKKTIGKVTGDPDNPGFDMKPASWGGLWPPKFGEHGASEPGDRASDRNVRIESAEKFTKKRFDEFFKIFWEPCKCYIKEGFRQK